MSSKNKKKKKTVSLKPQETAEHQDAQIYNSEDSAETTQNLYDVSQPEGADLSSASDDKVKKESPKPKTPAKNKKKKPASPKTPKKTEENTDSDKEKASEPEKDNAITEPEITAETENKISAEIPENVFDLEKEISVETTESIPDSVTEVSAETKEKSSDSEKKNSSVKTQKPAKQTPKKKKKKKKPAAKATDNKQSASKESGRKAVYTLDESDESAEKPESSGKDNTEEHAAVYYNISEESEKEIKSEESGEETKPVIFSVDEQETAEDGKEDGRVMYDVSEADRQDKEEETLESIKNELQEMAEKSEQKEEKIDHYENSYLLDEESSETAETKPENRYLAWLKTAAAAVAAFITTPFKKLGSFISGLFRKPIPESTALSFNESGQIIPVQIVDSDGNIVDLNKPETIAKLPLFKRLSVYWRNFISRIKEKIAARKEAKQQQQAEQQPEEIIYKSPLTRLKELIARIKEKIARKKEEQQAEQQQEAEEFEELEPADRRRLKVRRIANSFMGFVVFCVLLGALSGFSTIGVILNKTDVVLDISDIRNQDSTRIFDDQGEQIAIVGHESRISVSYSSFPQVVVDAFVAIEDSRYFEHPGFDMPRFAKAFLENIKSLSFAQGGSTLTMQVIKNTYFAVDTIAEKGIDRKVQEIYYSLKINKIVSKEKIFELYVNKVNFGATARGVQVASQYYFGKDCNNLTLVEAALLAGLVQAPNLNNPYYHLNDCTQRTRQVLYQMKNHGYITEEEYNFACKVKIENLLIGTQEYKYGSGETVSNQAYIDIVLNELQEVYDINPYETPVLIYTSMNQEVQNYCDEVSRGNVVGFPDEHINTSIVCIRNNTGELVGLCGGRDYDGKRMFNYAYDNRVNPGSTSKGIFTYPMAFENVPLATNHYIFDEPIYFKWSRTRVGEEHGYVGDVSTQRAFTTSYNVVAVKLFRWVEETCGMDVLADYLKSIDIDKNVVDGINEQYAIGMQNFRVSPVQLCGAESVILSHGRYIKPHTIRRIEFINSDREPIEASCEGKQVLSEGAAWLTRYLQEVSVNANGNADDWLVNGRLQFIKHKDYTVYGKTGTGLYDKNIIKKYKWPDNATKDYLMIGGTNDYSFAFWIGYDTGQYMDKTTYISNSLKMTRIDGKLVNGLLDTLAKTFGKPVTNNPRPDEVTTIRHIKGIYPYLKSGAISAPSATSYILKKHVNGQTYTSKFSYKVPTKLENLKTFTASYDADSKKLTMNWSTYPNPEQTRTGRSVKITFEGKTYTLNKKFDTSIITGVVQYCATVTNNSTGETQTVAGSKNSTSIKLTNNSDSAVTFTITGYYAWSKKDLMSNVITVTVTVPPQQTQPVDPPVEP